MNIHQKNFLKKQLMIKRLFFCLLSLLFIISCKSKTESASKSDHHTVDYAFLKRTLDSVYHEDQFLRSQIDSIDKAFGWNSLELSEHWKLISEKDSSNLVLVEDILAKHGWLSLHEVGSTASSTLFYVIQHADQQTQEKHLPMLREAVKEGKAKASRLALMEDRVLLGQGKMQLYGSQIGTNHSTGETYLYALKDPETVNERRLKMGLGPIEEYISNFDLTWDLETYKKNLPVYMELLQKEYEALNQ